MTGGCDVEKHGQVEKSGEVEKADDVRKLVGVESDGDIEIPGEVESRLFPRRPFVGVSIAVIRGDRVLLAARANAPMRGVWTLPGGLVEAGEALAEAALRELQEEVGLSAEVVGVLSPTEIVQRDGDGRVRHHYVVHPHAALWCGGEPEAGPEALGVRWAEPREVRGLETTPGLAETLAEAFAMVAARRAAGA